jgi:sugar O-acyltransferase (sialic acid O-acetyltransferase NeuD family)
MKIAIYGCGGFGREVAPLAVENGDEVLFISDNPEDHGEVAGHRCVGLDDVPADYRFVVAVSDGAIRKRLSEKARAAGLGPGSIIAKSARLLGRQTIGEEAIICDFVIITDTVKIGRGFQANTFAVVGHDSDIGDFVTLGPRASLNGNTVAEDLCHVAYGACLRNGVPGRPLRIGAGAFVGMGAVVTKDVPAGAVMVGNPARPLVRSVAA